MRRTGRHHLLYKVSIVFTLPLLLSSFTLGCSQVTQSSAPRLAVAATTAPTVQVAQTTPAPSEGDASASSSKASDPQPNPAVVPTVSSDPQPPLTRHGRVQQARVEMLRYQTAPANAEQVVFYNGAKTQKLVALTFDDGPDNKYTPKILDILKQNDVKATFFVIGIHATQYPNVLHRIVEEGHAIGNHTWDHAQLSKLNRTQVHNELSLADDVLYQILGYHPTIFRPPFGETAPNTVLEAKAMGYRLVDWSVDTTDWAGTSEPQIMKYVNHEMFPGGIILQHSAGGKNSDLDNTIAALPEIIKSLKAQDYQFVTIPQLLGIPAERP